jgi:hypothetical protein
LRGKDLGNGMEPGHLQHFINAWIGGGDPQVAAMAAGFLYSAKLHPQTGAATVMLNFGLHRSPRSGSLRYLISIILLPSSVTW